MMLFTMRNLKIFFRDKSAVFFSLMAVFVIIALYLLFLGDVWTENFDGVEGVRQLMDNWIVAGILTVASITTTMGAFGTMVNDKSNKIVKDIYASPIKRSRIATGYLFSAFLIGLIMSLVALVLCQIYIVANGGELFDGITYLKVIGMIVLSAMINTAVIFFFVSFFKSQNAFATASGIIGTMVGFVMGIYLPVGVLPQAVQTVIKCFPLSYEGTLMRQIIMEDGIAEAFKGAPDEAVSSFKEMMGIEFSFGDTVVSTGSSLAILAATGIVFFALSVIVMKKKH